MHHEEFRTLILTSTSRARRCEGFLLRSQVFKIEAGSTKEEDLSFDWTREGPSPLVPRRDHLIGDALISIEDIGRLD